MDLSSYFKLPDTPAERSPVGMLMPKILAKNPQMDFEQARAEAKRLLEVAAGRWKYAVPRVMSAEERESERKRLRSAFGRSAEVREAA